MEVALNKANLFTKENAPLARLFVLVFPAGNG
jgi:hypothetical protein